MSDGDGDGDDDDGLRIRSGSSRRSSQAILMSMWTGADHWWRERIFFRLATCVADTHAKDAGSEPTG
eukprot:3090072-Amphidinium_carterae.1